MNASSFEMRVDLPHDVRFVPTVRALAVYAAQYAGCADGEAEAFGRTVEEAVRGRLETIPADARIPIIVRRRSGPVEVLVDQRTIALNV
jgi:hypothetical protein